MKVITTKNISIGNASEKKQELRIIKSSISKKQDKSFYLQVLNIIISTAVLIKLFIN